MFGYLGHPFSWSILVGNVAAKAMLDKTIIDDEIIIMVEDSNNSAIVKNINPRAKAMAGYVSLKTAFLPFSLKINHMIKIGGAK